MSDKSSLLRLLRELITAATLTGNTKIIINEIVSLFDDIRDEGHIRAIEAEQKAAQQQAEIGRLREALTELENKTGHTFYGGNGSDIVCLDQRGMIVCSGPKDGMLAHAEKHNLACARLIPIRFHALEGCAG